MASVTRRDVALRPSVRGNEDAGPGTRDVFEQFFLVSPDMLCVAGFDGCFKRLNPAWENVLGYSAAEMLERSNLDFVHAEDTARTEAALSGLIRDVGEVVGFENRYRDRDGGYHWLLWSATSDVAQQLIFAVAKDITARKAGVAQTEVEVRHLTAMVRCSEDAIFTKDRDAIITSWNRGAEQMYGYSAAETVGRPTALLVPEDHFGEERRILDRVLAGRRVEQYETIRVTKDRTRIDVSLTAIALRDDSDEVIGAGVMSRNISDRKQAEDSSRVIVVERDHARLLEAANRDLEAFSYSVAHDLRAPLRTISGFGAMLQSNYGGQLPEEAQRYLRLMQSGAHSMDTLIDDLLAFARLGRQALRRNQLEPGDVARRALKQLAVQGGTPTSAVTFQPMPACRADAALLGQVFSNLLSNALKFTRDRPDPSIDVGFDPSVSRGEDPPGAYYVRDNGVGFDERYAHKLFGVFQRLHRADEYEGTGVGLAIVERIVARHGGRVWAESVLGQGSVFYFTLGDA
jgi:PAS domain S-box-containing protein